MSEAIHIQEVGITITAKDLSPTSINPDFLKYSDIIPSAWEVARPPVYTNRIVQIVYKNGLSLVIQPNRIDFIEVFSNSDAHPKQVYSIASKYVQKLSKVDYQGISINARAHTQFANKHETQRYLTTQILSPGPWSENSTGPVQAAIQLIYPQERGQLNLLINQAEIKRSETESDAAILFSGNYSFELEGENSETRLKDLLSLITDWSSCVETFEQIVQQFVHSSTNLLIPIADAA